MDNPKIVEMQIGKPGLRAAAKDSARFGLWLVMAADVADYFIRDKATLGQLLGELTIDIPSVLISSAVGAAVGSAVLSSTLPGALFVGSLACGPLLVAFGVGVIVGVALWAIDDHFHLTARLGVIYDDGLVKLRSVWTELGDEAHTRYDQLAGSHVINDMREEMSLLVNKIGLESDWVSRQMEGWWVSRRHGLNSRWMKTTAGHHESSSSRIRDNVVVLTLPYIAALAALVMFWIFWSELRPFLSGLSRGQSMISLRLRDMMGMPAGVMALCLAFLTFPPFSVRFLARRAAGTERWFSPGPLLIRIVIAGIVATVITVPITSVVSDTIATGHGYQECGAPRIWEAHPPKRWVLPGTPCP